MLDWPCLRERWKNKGIKTNTRKRSRREYGWGPSTFIPWNSEWVCLRQRPLCKTVPNISTKRRFFFFFFSLMGPEFSSGKITPKKRNEGTRKRYTQNIPADKKPTLPTIIRGSQCRSHYDDPGKKEKEKGQIGQRRRHAYTDVGGSGD